ncbi:3'-5' exonuclease [Duganella vulcania]|uniref:3'-5' exonuclease n=1 Tax=Duganella vulcania TaxID=2692166 RepID=A0A845GEC7_9BURK|nr:3'-5' exonuclease [Duganella vulcania]MYM92241.1 3'-5' exonuclease [Duganella vulcania]
MTATIRLLTKTQLKAERLKPAPDQRPAARYWQGRGWVYQYDAALAVAMKPYRAPSEAQSAVLMVGRQLAGTVLCPGCGQRIDQRGLDPSGCCRACAAQLYREEQESNWRATCRHAADLLALDPLFLDSETTGLDEEAEIVEVAVVDRHGVVLLETLVKPVGAVPAQASAIHGLTDADLADAPTWPVVAARLAPVVRGRVLIAHNASFDARMFLQSSRRHALAAPSGERWECTMELLTEANEGRWPRLSVAMSLAGAQCPKDVAGRPHRASYDALCCQRIVLALARRHTQFFVSEHKAEPGAKAV